MVASIIGRPFRAFVRARIVACTRFRSCFDEQELELLWIRRSILADDRALAEQFEREFANLPVCARRYW